MGEKKTGGIYLFLAVLAFAGLGFELVLGLIIEPAIFYAIQLVELKNIIHWILTSVIWLFIGLSLLHIAEQKMGLNLLEETEDMTIIQWVIVVVLVGLKAILSVMEWGGSKILTEFLFNGLLQFIFQYMYYVVEAGMMCLIILFGQLALEKLIGGRGIPYGGMLLALTWGLSHWLTQGSMMAGLSCAISAIAYGFVYLLTNRDLGKAYVIILIMFVL